MIGIFDSGSGGLGTLAEIRKIMPSIDICFYADWENAPYGTKGKTELLCLVKKDIEKLALCGAERILMACCTASTVYSMLPRWMQHLCIPIIHPTAAKAASATQNGRVGVIATKRTVDSHAFGKVLSDYSSVKRIFEVETQTLVSLIEGGCRDGCVTGEEKDRIYRLLKPLKSINIDTLILGCTHFPYLKREIEGCLPGVRIISSSEAAAEELKKTVNPGGKGKTVYVD
jgi:glutamate racemase